MEQPPEREPQHHWLIRLLLLSLLFIVLVHDAGPLLRAATSASLAPPSGAGAAPASDQGACLAAQLALGREGRMLQASLTARCRSPRPLAIAVPVYPPHFQYLLNFLEPLLEGGEALGWDLFPIFTNAGEEAAFAAFLEDRGLAEQYGGLFTPLVLDWDPLFAQRLAASQPWGIGFPYVLYKNYHAHALLHPCYEHLAVLDAEVAVLRPQDLAAAFAQRAQEGRVLAGYVPRYRYVNLWTTCMFDPEDKARLAGLTRDNCLYSWWSDIPVVIAADVPDFLAYIGYPVHFGSPENKEFGHLTYESWKVMRGDWQVVDLSDDPVRYTLCGSLEMMGRAQDYEAVREAFPPGPRWLTAGFCRRHSALCEGNEALVLMYHLNREEELLVLAERQTCERQHFDLDPWLTSPRQKQGCVWRNYSRSDVPPPIV